MPKLKSNKKTSKRFTLTATGKLKSRKPGQSHFNGRNSGKETRNKRRDTSFDQNAASTDTLKKYVSIKL